MATRTKKKATAVVTDPDLSLDGLDLHDLEDEELEVPQDEEGDGAEDDGDEGYGDEGDACLDDEPGEAVAKHPRRGRASRITDADKDAAVDAGQAAYERGEPLDAAPQGMHEDLRREWRYGWGRGKVAAHQGRGVTIYSHIPLEMIDPVKIRHALRRKEQGRRTREDPGERLPWTMFDLLGTTWANIWTCAWDTIGSIVADRWGNPVPAFERPVFPGGPHHRHLPTFCIGNWYDEHYSIDYWVRIDTLTPAEQLVWHAGRVANLRDHIAQERDSAIEIKENWDRTSLPATNYRMKVEAVKGYQEQLSLALQALHAFAKQHGLDVEPDHINGARWRDYRPRKGAAEQLSLI
jgi:hypothetical protein